MGCLMSCSIHMGWTSTMIAMHGQGSKVPKDQEKSRRFFFHGEKPWTREEPWKTIGTTMDNRWETMENLGLKGTPWWNSHQKPNVQTEAIDGKGVLGVGCAPVLLMRRSRWPFCKRQLICWKQGWLVETATSRQEECERIQPRREHIVLETLGSLLHSSY